MNVQPRQYKLLIVGGLLWATLITILRALRWPNDWAEAHWLISYEFGFLKRALPGTIISPFTGAQNPIETAFNDQSGRQYTIFCLYSFFIMDLRANLESESL